MQTPRLVTMGTSRSFFSPCNPTFKLAQQLKPHRQSITTALTDSIRQYYVENGRTYHSYHAGRTSLQMVLFTRAHIAIEYLYPNDEVGRVLHISVLDSDIHARPSKVG